MIEKSDIECLEQIIDTYRDKMSVNLIVQKCIRASQKEYSLEDVAYMYTYVKDILWQNSR